MSKNSEKKYFTEKYTLASDNTKDESAVGVRTVMLEIADEVGGVRHAHDAGLYLPFAAAGFVINHTWRVGRRRSVFLRCHDVGQP